jgi:hypothetical protein
VKWFHCKACGKALFLTNGQRITSGAITFRMPRRFTFTCDACEDEITIERHDLPKPLARSLTESLARADALCYT